MPEETRALCPNCKMPLEKSVEDLNREAATTGAVQCEACGAKFQLSDVVGENLNMEPAVVEAAVPQRQGGRNPFALVVVAIVAAGMLYFGFSHGAPLRPDAPVGYGPWDGRS